MCGYGGEVLQTGKQHIGKYVAAVYGKYVIDAQQLCKIKGGYVFAKLFLVIT